MKRSSVKKALVPLTQQQHHVQVVMDHPQHVQQLQDHTQVSANGQELVYMEVAESDTNTEGQQQFAVS